MAHRVEIVSKNAKTTVKIDGIEVHPSALRFEHDIKNKCPEIVMRIPALDVSLDADFLPCMPEPWRTFWNYGGHGDSGNSDEK